MTSATHYIGDLCKTIISGKEIRAKRIRTCILEAEQCVCDQPVVTLNDTPPGINGSTWITDGVGPDLFIRRAEGSTNLVIEENPDTLQFIVKPMCFDAIVDGVAAECQRYLTIFDAVNDGRRNICVCANTLEAQQITLQGDTRLFYYPGIVTTVGTPAGVSLFAGQNRWLGVYGTRMTFEFTLNGQILIGDSGMVGAYMENAIFFSANIGEIYDLNQLNVVIKLHHPTFNSPRNTVQIFGTTDSLQNNSPDLSLQTPQTIVFSGSSTDNTTLQILRSCVTVTAGRFKGSVRGTVGVTNPAYHQIYQDCTFERGLSILRTGGDPEFLQLIISNCWISRLRIVEVNISNSSIRGNVITQSFSYTDTASTGTVFNVVISDNPDIRNCSITIDPTISNNAIDSWVVEHNNFLRATEGSPAFQINQTNNTGTKRISRLRMSGNRVDQFRTNLLFEDSTICHNVFSLNVLFQNISPGQTHNCLNFLNNEIVDGTSYILDGSFANSRIDGNITQGSIQIAPGGPAQNVATPALLTDCSISDNILKGTQSDLIIRGEGDVSSQSYSVTGCIFSNNRVNRNILISTSQPLVFSHTLAIEGCTFDHNVVTGGLLFGPQFPTAYAAPILFSESTVTGNVSSGIGMEIRNASVRVINFSNNMFPNGGILARDDPAGTFNRCTFCNNNVDRTGIVAESTVTNNNNNTFTGNISTNVGFVENNGGSIPANNVTVGNQLNTPPNFFAGNTGFPTPLNNPGP
uniref:Uncharacterized protein n=1 Tax=viral metagenome TaxID=1070528 RepID=A0A6C0BNG9_9ZZZZ